MNDGRGDGFERMPRHPGHDDGHFETMPRRPGHDDGHFETMPRRPGHDGGHFEGRHGHDGGHFEGRHGHGGRGMPPCGPGMGEDMLAERIDDAELPELLELAGRMASRRPGGDAGRGQALALSVLAGRESMSQRALQQLLGVQPGSMSELVGKLERKGLLTRERGEDRRGNLLRITPAGRAAVPEGEDALEEEVFSALTESQRASLKDMLRTLLRDWAVRFAPGGRERHPARAERPRALPAPHSVEV